jgi:RimJ/RimL family protein N-acetyltransferase
MQIVTEPVEYLAQWAADRIRGVEHFDNPAAIGVCRGDQLAAVAVYTDIKRWKGGGDCQISFAADTPKWATRETIGLFLGTPFQALGVSRITALVKKGHKRSRKLIEGVGFKREGAVRRADPDGSTLIIYGLLKEEFEAGKYGR